MGKEQGDMQKNKLLLLTEILKQETDADHPITTKAIIEKLSGYPDRPCHGAKEPC